MSTQLVLLTFLVNRFIVIVFPMRSRSVCTLSNCRRSVVFVWVVSLVIACPIIWVTDVESDTYTNPNRTITLTIYYCSDFDSIGFLIYQLLVLFVIPGLLMIVFYTSVIRELWKSTKNIKALTNSTRSGGPAGLGTSTLGTPAGSGGLRVNGTFPVNGRLLGSSGDSAYNSSTSLYVPYGAGSASSHLRTPSPTSRAFTKKSREKGEDVKKARKQVIKMLIMVVVLFLLCWGSRLTFELIIVLKLQIFDQIFYTCKVTFWLLPFIHCCINPVIYCFMSKNFRRSMLRLLGSPCQSYCNRRGGCCSCCLRSRRPIPKPLLTRAAARSLYSSCSPDNSTRHTDMETVSSI
ncbi:gastrin/cholecystokinin type B receptor-like [Oratosquilla oratoria]|uniref:gastrin/cholecystokinin type B receptor-like n=1 Tax=Oratosquilla oratoria TaxID=337810 RepID=UPI003F75FD12